MLPASRYGHVQELHISWKDKQGLSNSKLLPESRYLRFDTTNPRNSPAALQGYSPIEPGLEIALLRETTVIPRASALEYERDRVKGPIWPIVPLSIYKPLRATHRVESGFCHDQLLGHAVPPASLITSIGMCYAVMRWFAALKRDIESWKHL
jgi:hypothetical protein